MDEQPQSRWQPTRRQLLWAGAVLALLTLLAIAIRVGYRYDITLWDWIKLLIVPAVIAGGGIWFNRQQRERELELASQQRERELELAQHQREQELEIAERRTQDEALQAYLDQMSGMLLPNTDQPSLYKARPGDSLSSVARARTLTVLPRLDGDRKARVVQFLYEAGLIAQGRPVLDLSDAVLSGANLGGANLSGTNLQEANLQEANLQRADLRDADLSGTNLQEANLQEANLQRAGLRDADLQRAHLSKAHLREANLSQASLRETNLFRADLSVAHLSRANLFRADLSVAHLSGADLRGANLSRANLSGADLSRANLFRADLSGADLSEARGWTEKQLQQAKSLINAIMPNGQKYEDWLKDKESRKQNE